MQHVVDRNQEMMNNIIKAIEELSILRDNLTKKEVSNSKFLNNEFIKCNYLLNVNIKCNE